MPEKLQDDCTRHWHVHKKLLSSALVQDLEILKGYVPSYNQVLGHEFVGVVEECPSQPSLEGQRVVGEINCRCHGAKPDADPIFERNHSPGRTVLGIIGKDVGHLFAFV